MTPVAPVAAFISYRLGGTDGVSIEAGKWQWALHELGFTTRRVAGELHDEPLPGDVTIANLAINGVDGPDQRAIAAALDGASLVVVENLCSLPLNLAAARATAAVLASLPARMVFHHHDLAWQRPHLAHLTEFPPRRRGSLHVTINDVSRQELAQRGIDAVTIRNAFDFDDPPGDRELTRKEMRFADDELVVIQPTRAIARKNVPAGLYFAEQLSALVTDRPVRYWLTGPAEDGYDATLAATLAGATVLLADGRAPRPSDAYAAADVVVFPSGWEGFGNPVIESIVARRPIAVADYPVLHELRDALDLELWDVTDPEAMAAWLASADPVRLEANRERARAQHDVTDLPARLRAAFETVGWSAW
jgi:mannosylglucosylglycerate synthase